MPRYLVLNNDRHLYDFDYEGLIKRFVPEANVLVLRQYAAGADFDRTVEAFCSTKVDGIVAASEGDVLLSADLRFLYSVQGLKPEEAILYRDKIAMKNLARTIGLKLPACSAIESAEEAREFVKKHGYPVAVKPRKSVSALGVYKCTDAATLEAAVAEVFKNPNPDYMIEAWTKGEILHLDGFVVEGAPPAIWPTCYSHGCYEFALGDKVMWDTMLEVPPAGSIEFARKLLDGFGLKNSTYHLEVFWNQETGEINLCEIAARTGGDLIGMLWAEAFGLDLDEISCLLQAGIDLNSLREKAREFQKVKVPPKAVAYVLFPREDGILVEGSNSPNVEGAKVVHSLRTHVRYTSWHALSSVAMRAFLEAPDWAALEAKKPLVEKWYYETHRWQKTSMRSMLVRVLRKVGIH